MKAKFFVRISFLAFLFLLFWVFFLFLQLLSVNFLAQIGIWKQQNPEGVVALNETVGIPGFFPLNSKFSNEEEKLTKTTIEHGTFIFSTSDFNRSILFFFCFFFY